MTSLSPLFDRGAPFVPVLSLFGHAAVALSFPALPFGYELSFPSLRSGQDVRSRLSPFGHAAVAVFFPALPFGYDFAFPSLRSGRTVRSRLSPFGHALPSCMKKSLSEKTADKKSLADCPFFCQNQGVPRRIRPETAHTDCERSDLKSILYKDEALALFSRSDRAASSAIKRNVCPFGNK